MIWFGVIAGVVLVCLASLVYVTIYLRWEAQETAGMAYYGRPLAERRALKRRIRWYSLPALPVVHLLAAMARKNSNMPTFEFEGVSGPTKVSSPEVFARAKSYQPRPEDVFVVTQMRCGTTWMQQVVYEIVTRGGADFDNQSQPHLYALCPWIDAVNSVSMEQAPLVGERPTRIIKCHLPTQLCPYSPDAKYIYVARHPVSCFASIVDFNRSMLGPLIPPVTTMADWFCSDRMYWLPWPKHVEGWWQWAERRDNVLFVHFEEMKKDFGAVCDRVSRFIGVELTADEKARVAERCSFAYMKNHEEFFEMAPPTMFSVNGGEYMASGKSARHEDVSPAIRERIADYSRRALEGSDYPVQRFYPDLTSRPAASA
jgi:hypothetical protein